MYCITLKGIQIYFGTPQILLWYFLTVCIRNSGVFFSCPNDSTELQLGKYFCLVVCFRGLLYSSEFMLPEIEVPKNSLYMHHLEKHEIFLQT